MQLEAVPQRGRFEVTVDGRRVAARKGGLLAKLLGKPWPTVDEIVRAVQG